MQIQSPTSLLPSTLADALRRNAAALGGGAGLSPGVIAGAVAGSSGLGGAAPAAAGSFGGALDQALRAVSGTQLEASRLAETFTRDPSQASLEETMVAMQKAQIGFQSALHVRNRLVSAYSDIMNMQV